MRKRLKDWVWQMLISIDQSGGVWVFGWLYVIFGGEPVYADETVSSRTGRAAVRGARWGLVLEVIIDRICVQFGDAPGHCRRNIEPQFVTPTK